ncbi:hypothetical protein Fmac_012105 [Flemingia macrophylla]|uniref:Uncharacterized protein n=1 Tax=Flemingia macrophylla TaxID=520843 RepID=A0ABD1MPD0_9FABA
MENINGVLNNGITSGEIKGMSPSLSIASSKPEESTPSNDRHLPDLVEDTVPAQDGDGAAIVLAFNKSEVHSHEKSHLALGGGGVEPLSLPHKLRAQLGAQGQRVVDHVDQPKGRGGVNLRGRWNNHDRCGTPSTLYVVPIELELAELFLFQAQQLAVHGTTEGLGLQGLA